MQSNTLTLFVTLIAAGSASLFAESSSTAKSPTSKFYVAEVKGVAEVNTGKKIEGLTERAVFDADGTVIETKTDSVNSLVMSNGTGVYFAADTKMAINRFLQEPFAPNRTDLETEPSMSQTRTTLSRGSVGICTGKLVAGSSMIYNTPNISLNILSQNKQRVAIQSTDEVTTVTLFSGDLTMSANSMSGGEHLQSGYQAVIRSRGLNQPPLITINPIPDDKRDSLEDMVNSACQARRKVYFDVGEHKEGAPTELKPVLVAPVKPSEIGPIVSPARL